jgi:hypothetical protein
MKNFTPEINSLAERTFRLLESAHTSLQRDIEASETKEKKEDCMKCYLVFAMELTCELLQFAPPEAIIHTQEFINNYISNIMKEKNAN